MEQLEAQLKDALAERANIYDALKTSDQKVAALRNAVSGYKLAEAIAEKEALEAQGNPLEPTE